MKHALVILVVGLLALAISIAFGVGAWAGMVAVGVWGPAAGIAGFLATLGSLTVFAAAGGTLLHEVSS